MKYMGSKNRIAKNILPIILKDRKDGQWYVEPFVCVWQKEIQSGLNTNSTKKGIEKLFVHESQLQVSFL